MTAVGRPWGSAAEVRAMVERDRAVRAFMVNDATLVPAVEVLHKVTLTGHGTTAGQVLAECLTAQELELILSAVRDVLAAPVLAIHVPAVNQRFCAGCSHHYPCPTIRALGVTS